MPDMNREPNPEAMELNDQMQSLLEEASASLPSMRPGYFDEQFDLDLEFENYEKIETPDFTNGRRGRFVHDFGKVGVLVSCIRTSHALSLCFA